MGVPATRTAGGDELVQGRPHGPEIADLGAKTATVKFDTDKTDIQALIDATTGAGYPSTLKQ